MSACRKLAGFVLIIGLPFQAATSVVAQDTGGLPPEIVSLTTSDNVQLRATYFPPSSRKGTPQGKQTTPVVLLHDFKGTRAVFMPLALKLQAPGDLTVEHPYFAAIVVDLRGHGESTKQISPEGGVTELDAAKLSKDGMTAMAALDMEAVRSFLVDKNDAGELNLNKLCIVGSGMGASVAVNWALHDWTVPPLAVGKQGQDVKGLVLISPRWTFNGLSMQDAMKFGPLKQNCAWMLIGGAQDQKAKMELARVQSQLEKSHPLTNKAGAPQRKGLETIELQSSLQGDTLVSKSGDSIDAQIIRFLTENVAAVQQPWSSRRSKLP
ncbi:MAG TPA: alpha/beta hydrolase [Lacipirellulaceae bacterium]|jgi:pimeloyl-ACP methyl ester carboxylesterase|nr:alpha/beta hydrolase [Lacipirellulaceae bacterium]